MDASDWADVGDTITNNVERWVNIFRGNQTPVLTPGSPGAAVGGVAISTNTLLLIGGVLVLVLVMKKG